ncbi:MAG: M56 family metallopeptidase [Planctomycetota bacterium]|jgi:hypothetical protein
MMTSDTIPRLFPWIEHAGPWLLTYLLHSTVLLGSFWLITRGSRFPSEALKDALWKFAVIGGLITATVQVGLGIDPLSGRIQLEEKAGVVAGLFTQDRQVIHLDESVPVAAESLAADTSPACLHGLSGEGRIAEEMSCVPQPCDEYVDCTRSTPLMDFAEGEQVSKTGGGTAGLLALWPAALVGLCFLLSAFALIRLLLCFKRLRNLLLGRRSIDHGPLPDLLEALCRKAGYHAHVRLTASPKISIPLAVGIFKPEICLPEKAVHGLRLSEQRSMLAHELAHLKRRDPAWLAYFRLLESLFVFQPLNRLSRNFWLEAAEYRCDAWAARLLGGGMPLARCLTRVAGWLFDPPQRLAGVPAHGMAQNGNSLTRRVSRLLDAPRPERRHLIRPLLAFGLPLGLWIMIFGAPGFFIQAKAETTLDEDLVMQEAPCCEECMAATRSLSEAISVLDAELAAVEEEVSALREAVVMTGLQAELIPFIEEMELRVNAVKIKRFRIQQWVLERTLETYTHVPEGHPLGNE